MSLLLSLLVVSASSVDAADFASLPVVVNTWAFTDATDAAWDVLTHPSCDRTALKAVEEGCTICEENQCDFTVGYGGSPDEEGHTSLDAMVMCGATLNAGAVGNLRGVRQAVKAARLVMDHTNHTLLAGEQAADFALMMGLPPADTDTQHSGHDFADWEAKFCQPNFRRNVSPNPRQHCGPYKPLLMAFPPEAGFDAQASQQGPSQLLTHGSGWVAPHNHDTIAMVAVDLSGNIAAGASSNGASHKVPGRLGDAAVPGGGAYADNTAGGCGSTGDGDLHLRLLPCYQVVENLRRGMEPQQAAEDAIRRIAMRYPKYIGAVVAVDTFGRHAGACYGWTFQYSVRSHDFNGVVTVEPLLVAGS